MLRKTKPKVKKKQKIVPITMSKSTVLINSIGRQQITSLKLFNMALYNLRDMDEFSITEEQKAYMKGELLEKSRLDFSEGINAVFKEKDFLSLIPGRNSNWTDLRDTLFPADDIGSGSFVDEFKVLIPGNDGKTSGVVNLISGAYYDTKDKTFYIKFINKKDAPNIAKELMHLSLHTKVSLSLEMGLKSQFTLKFYELINGEITNIIKDSNFKARDEYIISIGTNKLKWLIGYMSTKPDIPPEVESSLTQRLKISETNEDFDNLTNDFKSHLVSTYLRYDKFRDLLVKILDEINDSEFAEKVYEIYEEVKKGREKKLIRFRVSTKKSDDTIDEPVLEDSDIVIARTNTIARVRDIIIEVSPIINNAFDDESCLKIATEARYDYDMVRNGFVYLKDQAEKEKIKNAMGVVLYGMKNYKAPIELTPDMFYGGGYNDMSDKLGKVRKIIRNADYNVENMSDEDREYAEKKSKYLYLDMVDADKRVKSTSTITLMDVVNILKVNDTVQDAIINTKEITPDKAVQITTSIDEETGQVSMRFYE